MLPPGAVARATIGWKKKKARQARVGFGNIKLYDLEPNSVAAKVY